MEQSMGPAQLKDPTDVYSDTKKLGRKLASLVIQTEKSFENHVGPEMIQNMAFWRGKFWRGDGAPAGMSMGSAQYNAVRNEIFPILDTITSSLAMDLPQVEAMKRTVNSEELLNRENDPTIRGKRVSAVLNNFAEEDDLDETVWELVLHSLLFVYGVVKTSWSARLGRPVVRVKLPWEVYFDPNARHIRDASWAFERVTLHWDTFKSRAKNGVYDPPEDAVITPDCFPRGLLEKSPQNFDQYAEDLRRHGLKEFVSIVEWWDFRRGKLYHIHPETKTILMEVDAPYGRPYEVLTFHSGVGRIEGIPLCSLLASNQRDVNEASSARRQVANRMVPRDLIDRAFFKNETDWSRFKNAKMWEPTRVDVPNGRNLREAIHSQLPAGTTFDFQKHLDDNVESMRRTAGESDAQRGRVQNIRTAEEVQAVQAGVQGRNGVKVNRIEKVVTRVFRHILEVFRWAIENPEASSIDMESITYKTQDDVGPGILIEDVLAYSGKFRLLPFSPAMEDKNARRAHLERMLPHLKEMAKEGIISKEELARELVDEFGLRPSLAITPPPAEAAPGMPPGMPPGMDPTGMGGAPPLQLGGAMPPLPQPPAMMPPAPMV